MRRPFIAVPLVLACSTCWGADWLTDGHDPQRTGWQTDETILTTSNVKNLKLLWKINVAKLPTQKNLFPPLIVEKVNTPSGPREIAILATSGDGIYAIDVAKGEIIWSKRFDTGEGSGGCRAISVPTIGPAATPGKYTVYAISSDGKFHQLNVADGEDIASPEPFMPPNVRYFSANLLNGVIYTVSGDNCGGHTNRFYAFDPATSKTTEFSDGSGGMWGTRGPAIGADGTVYAGTGDGVFDPAHGMYGNGILGVKQNPKTKVLELSKYFGPSNAEYLYKRDLDVNVTPSIFTYKGKEYMVGSSKECKLWLLDTSNFGGEDHRTAVYRTPLMCNEFSNYSAHGVWGALSNWVDSKGTQWVVTPFWGPKVPEFKAPIEYGEVVHGAVAAFKVEEKNGKLQLTPAWISRDMNRADPPVIANGIVFGYGSGKGSPASDTGLRAERLLNRGSGEGLPVPDLTGLEPAAPAIVYALDGQTGKELWSSGDQISSFNHQSGLTVANGRVYIGTNDGFEYCFGLGR